MGNVHDLIVNEIFGVTFQGEGLNTGMPCVFLRTTGCNQSCVWCDTPYTWDWSRFDIKAESHKMSVEEAAEKLQSYPVKNLVISGGEPMLQQRSLGALTNILHNNGYHTEIETAGTIVPADLNMVSHWTCSPKLENSGNEKRKRYNAYAIDKINTAKSSCFKFVVSELDDFKEIDEIVDTHRLKKVYIMPLGTKKDDVNSTMQRIAETAIGKGYWLSQRLHVQMYGDKRGV